MASTIAATTTAAVLTAFPGRLIGDAKMRKSMGEEMTNLTPYLLFDGRCQQAMEFYQSCFGGELNLTKVKDSPIKDRLPAAQQKKVLHAQLRSNRLEISASDWMQPDRQPVRGNTVCLYLSGGALPELKALFEKLSDGADVTDPLQEQFFGTYGALNDKFGVRWMFQNNDKV
jgi:PhnB protein